GDGRSAAWSGSHDDVGGAGGVRVPGGDIDPAGEAWIEGEEAVQNRAVGSVEDGNVWPAAGSGAADDFRLVIPDDVAGRDADSAGELRIEGKEVAEFRTVSAAEDDDVGAAAGVGADDDVSAAVAVHVSGCDPDS